MPGIGVGVWLGSTRSHGGSTPNDLRVGGSRLVRGWYSAHPSVGSWTLDSASVPADPDTWDSNNEVTVTGSGPYVIRATTTDDRHYCYHSNPTADISSYCSIAVVATVVGSQEWVRVWAGADWANVNLLTGAAGNKSGADVTPTVAVGSATVAFLSVAARDCRVELLDSDDASATPGGYAGSTSDGIDGTITFIQPRISGWMDRSKMPTTEDDRGADVGQGNNDLQPGFGAPFDLVNGIAVPHREAGRASYLESAHADLMVCNGDDTSYAAWWIGASSENQARPFYWIGGPSWEQPCIINPPDVNCARYDGGTQTTKSYGNLVSELSSLTSVAIIAIGLERYLYIGGALAGSCTLDDVGAVATTGIRLMGTHNHTTPEVVLPEFALFTDCTALGGHADIYAALKAYGLNDAAARFGVTA